MRRSDRMAANDRFSPPLAVLVLVASCSLEARGLEQLAARAPGDAGPDLGELLAADAAAEPDALELLDLGGAAAGPDALELLDLGGADVARTPLCRPTRFVPTPCTEGDHGELSRLPDGRVCAWCGLGNATACRLPAPADHPACMTEWVCVALCSRDCPTAPGPTCTALP